MLNLCGYTIANAHPHRSAMNNMPVGSSVSLEMRATVSEMEFCVTHNCEYVNQINQILLLIVPSFKTM